MLHEMNETKGVPAAAHARESAVLPTGLFMLCAAALLGPLAWYSATDMLWQPPVRDIWQHAAALQALIDNPLQPANPFVLSDTGSRHFHPLWVGWASVARAVGLDVWQVLAAAAYTAMALLAFGIYSFARALHTSPWAPLVLLFCLMFGWILPIQHTGFHAPATLIYAAAYPATYLVGTSFVLWAVTLRALALPVSRAQALYISLVVVLAALKFATHQLGAVIGLLGAASFAVCWPNSDLGSRLRLLSALIFGVLLSRFWFHFSPLELVLRPGNSDWNGGPDFYGAAYLLAAFAPPMVGLVGLLRPRHRALLLAAAAYLAVYLVGLTGFQLAGRFLAPVVLILQTGLALLILDAMQRHRVRLLPLSALAMASIIGQGLFFDWFDIAAPEASRAGESFYLSAKQLTDDIPDDEQVAAHPETVWPVVATGQRVLSIPWPEPLIDDLAMRQAATAALFSADLSAADRVVLARAHGVRSLIVPPADLHPDALAALQDQAVFSETSGTLSRFDLYD